MANWLMKGHHGKKGEPTANMTDEEEFVASGINRCRRRRYLGSEEKIGGKTMDGANGKLSPFDKFRNRSFVSSQDFFLTQS